MLSCLAARCRTQRSQLIECSLQISTLHKAVHAESEPEFLRYSASAEQLVPRPCTQQ